VNDHYEMLGKLLGHLYKIRVLSNSSLADIIGIPEEDVETIFGDDQAAFEELLGRTY